MFVKKKCSICLEKKPVSDFYLKSKLKKTTGSYCKLCSKKIRCLYRKKDKKDIENQKEIVFPKYKKNNKTIKRMHKAAYEKKYPLKSIAHAACKMAVKRKILTRPFVCEFCEKISKTQAHHDDYNRPFDVWWLCQPCHRIIHRIKNEKG